MWRAISKETAKEIAVEVAKQALQWALPLVVAVIGLVEEFPWFYVIVGVIVSGAGVMTWLVRFDEWRARNRVEHKLLPGSGKIHLTQNNDQVAAIQFGLDLKNTAAFPINWRVDDIKTHITMPNGRSFYPPSKETENTVFVVSIGGRGFFFDHNILLPENIAGPAWAYVKYKLSYGKSNKYGHSLEIHRKTQINFSGPSISGAQHWFDIPKT